MRNSEILKKINKSSSLPNSSVGITSQYVCIYFARFTEKLSLFTSRPSNFASKYNTYSCNSTALCCTSRETRFSCHLYEAEDQRGYIQRRVNIVSGCFFKEKFNTFLNIRVTLLYFYYTVLKKNTSKRHAKT